MKTKWVEFTCDYCGCADHYMPGAGGAVEKCARGNGWIITGDGRHFCSRVCYSRRPTGEDSQQEGGDA